MIVEKEKTTMVITNNNIMLDIVKNSVPKLKNNYKGEFYTISKRNLRRNKKHLA